MKRQLPWDLWEYIERELTKSAIALPGGCLIWGGPGHGRTPRLMVQGKTVAVRRVWFEHETDTKLLPGQQVRQNADCQRLHGASCIASEHQHVTDGRNDNTEACRRYVEQRRLCRVCGVPLRRTIPIPLKGYRQHRRHTKWTVRYKRERHKLRRFTEGFKLGFCPLHLRMFEKRLLAEEIVSEQPRLDKKWVQRKKGRTIC